MKLLLAAFALLLLLGLAGAMTTQCSQFTSETGCENSGCSWCDRCVGKEINPYGWDRCVESSLSCTYNCSRTCGANCTADNDCSVNLTDTTCFYAGTCGACSCNYRNATCPQNGTIIEQYGDQVCYFGARYCTSGGCSINSCVLRTNTICDPVDGCVSCQDDCKQNDASASYSSDEYIIDKKCQDGDVFGRQVTYDCTYNGQCNVTRTDVLVEKCKADCSETFVNGINRPKCNDELCNIDGLKGDCNRYDGFYGDSYCAGNDIYQGYRDYKCGNNECAYDTMPPKKGSCNKSGTTPSASVSLCQNGRCHDSGTVIIVNRSESPGGQEPAPPSANVLTNMTVAGGRGYSGGLFGQNDITVPANGRSGKISFRITRTNGLGTLTINQETTNTLRHTYSQTVFSTRSAGSYEVSFNGSLRMQTTGSGWLFFMPAVYDVGTILVLYD